MECVACNHCQNFLTGLEGMFYRMKDGNILCENCATDPSAVLHGLKNDETAQLFIQFEKQLRELSAKGVCPVSASDLYRQVQWALKVRAEEMWNAHYQEEAKNESTVQVSSEPAYVEPTAIVQAPEAQVSSNWSCSRCQFSNLPGNPICYQCRTSRDGTFAPVYESESVTDFALLTLREGSLPWTCKCGREHPVTVKRCECGYLNLALIGEDDAEPEAPLPASGPIATSVPAGSMPPAMVWKCRECGYEWNQQHLTACIKCNKQNLAIPAPPALSQQVHASPIPSQQIYAPQMPAPINSSPEVPASVIPPSMAIYPHLPVPTIPQAPEEQKTAQPMIGKNPTIWTCSCEYPYNLVTAENCTKCNLPNPFLPAKPPSIKCVKCGTRDITQSDNTCWTCHNKAFVIKPSPNTYWTCVPCNYDSNRINEKCWRCKRTQEEVCPELKKNPTNDSPQKALWQCTKCGIGNEPARMKCISCDHSKGIIRCSTCGSPKEYPLAVCTQCMERKQLQERSNKEAQESNPLLH